MEERAKGIIDKLSGITISGCSPRAIAGASIYVASILCGCRRTQKDISKVSGITEDTIRIRYMDLCEKLGMTHIVKRGGCNFIVEKGKG